MKKILFYLVLCYSTITFSQESIFGGTPVKGVIPIKREVIQSPTPQSKVEKIKTPTVTESQGTGNSQEVGVTEGQLSVSLTGGANYNIPIAVPPGINGVVPQITLSYNSQGGNGLAGYGWNIGGISVISKIPATKFHDGIIDGVDFDDLDRYSFDGQRLMVKNGTSGVYGADGTVYETESFSNVKITSYGVSPRGVNFGPAYFEVLYPDGSKALYGYNANDVTPTDWAITSWTNPQGVTVTYTYINHGNNLSINRIFYGTLFNALPLNFIDFIYKTRNRFEQAYIGGQNFIRSNILSEIKVMGSSGVGFRNYFLSHEITSLGYERLKSVTEKSGDNTKSYNPTIFNYDTTSNSSLFQISDPITLSIGSINDTSAGNLSGDFDGDGKMDFIIYPKTGVFANKKYYLFNELSGQGLNIGAEHTVGDFTDIFATSWLNHSNKLMPMQGWCVIQNNLSNNETSFNNFSIGYSYPIYNQYSKVYTFPKYTYFEDCPNLIHCWLLESNKTTNNKNAPGQVNKGDIRVDPIDGEPIDPDACGQPVNLVLSDLGGGDANLSWDQFGTSIVPMWEVCYIEPNIGSAPTNTDPIGTYNTVTQNSFIASNLDPAGYYAFYVRTICRKRGGNVASNWSGPIYLGVPIIVPVEKQIVIPKEYLNGDFNGDGLTDVIAIEKGIYYQSRVCQSNCYTTINTFIPGGKTYFVNLDRRLTTDFVSLSGQIPITPWSKFVVADVNNDGKSDIMMFDSGTVKVYTLNESNYLVPMINYSDPSVLGDKPSYMGDFNGDGKMDFVVPQENNVDSWSFFFSMGNDFKKITTSIGIIYSNIAFGYYGIIGYSSVTYSRNEINFVTNDFNGDGKTDILVQQNFTVEYEMTRNGADYTNKGLPQVTKLVLLENKFSNGTGIGFSYASANAQVTGVRTNSKSLFLDHNSINNSLEYALISGNVCRTFKSTKDNKIDTSLKEIVLGNGVRERISYAPLNAGCDLPNNCDIPYQPSTYTENYPNFDIKVANSFKVVSKLEQFTSTQFKQQKFKYYGAVSNLDGIGFIGFRGIARTNWFNSTQPVISSITKHDITKKGAIFENYTALGEVYGNFTNYTPINFIAKSTMTYVDLMLPNKVYKINNPTTNTQNGFDQTSKEVTTDFDDYNNPKTTTSVYKSGSIIEKKEFVKIEYAPVSNISNYIIGRIKKKNVEVKLLVPNIDITTSEEVYTFNSNNLISKIEKKGHLTDFITEENQYDTFGNITEKKISAGSLEPRITKYGYDASGRFLTWSEDIERLKTDFDYYYSSGLLKHEILPSNDGYPLKTTYFYDAWGKKTKTTDYLGKSQYYSYNWLSSSSFLGFLSSGNYKITTTGDDDSANYVWFDELGRKLATGVKTINDANAYSSNISWTTNQYDINNNVIKTYEPQLSALPQWSGLSTTTIFDEYGRLEKITEPSGKVTSIQNLGLITSVSDGISNTTTKKNSLGIVIQKTDNGGTINFQHFANGNLKQSNFEGVISTITQDGWGRKTQLDDTSAGTYIYKYNAFGETLKETTPKGITEYKIDDYGKVIEKTVKDLSDNISTTTKYNYDQTTKLLKDSKYEDILGGFYTTYFYQYDEYRRVKLVDEIGFNAYFQKAVEFDNFGRPSKEFYAAVNTDNNKSSNKWVKNTYKNGHHWQILDDATQQILWQTDMVNAKGQLLAANYGNGISINNSYNAFGHPTQFLHNQTQSPYQNVMTLNTLFSQQRGNLDSRYNSLFDVHEDFTYDNLDRLKTWTENKRIQNFKFTDDTEAFLPSTGGVNVEQGIFLGNPRLLIYTPINFEGVIRKVKENANVGDKLQFSGEQYLRSSNFSQDYLKYFIVEYDQNTGETAEFELYNIATLPNNFSFQHTVSQYSEIHLKIVAGNDVYFQPVKFQLDNIKVIEASEVGQGYDNLGRIKKNNVGDYNYKNNDKPFQNTSVDLNQQYNEYFISRNNLDITYNAFKSPIDIIEEGKDKISFIYNINNSRSTMYYGSNDNDKMSRPFRKHYSADGSMEIKRDLGNDTTEFIFYIGGDAYTAPVILKSDGTTQNYVYLHRDYLGSILAITDETGAIIEKRHFDAWGNIANVADGQNNELDKLTFFDRGYTGHEHLQGVVLIHMNGRLYDPKVHRFLQSDNYVQDHFDSQNYNRYSYVLNNPLKFTDPSGEFAWIPVIIGAIIGGYSGGVIANGGELNPTKWELNIKTLGYIIGGAIVGGITGGVSNGIATSGVAYANTQAIIAGSVINSLGTHLYTGGKTDVTLSFGFASLNLTSGEFGYLFKSGNSFMENLGYGLGAMATIQDVLAGMNPQNAQIQTENTSTAQGKDNIGHLQVLDPDGNSLIDFGPFDAGTGSYTGFSAGRNNWIEYASNGKISQSIKMPDNIHVSPITIRGLNMKRLTSISHSLKSNPGSYNFLLNSCSSVASRALASSGYFAIGGIHPYFLRASIFLREAGFRPSLLSFHLTK